MAKGAKHMKKLSAFAFLALAIVGVYVVNWSNSISISKPDTEVSAPLDPIAVASAAYVPPSGASDEKCNEILMNIGKYHVMGSEDAQQLEKLEVNKFFKLCEGGQ